MHLNGVLNHHNNVYWAEERPEEIDEKCLKDSKVIVLSALNAKKEMLGQYCFEDTEQDYSAFPTQLNHFPFSTCNYLTYDKVDNNISIFDKIHLQHLSCRQY